MNYLNVYILYICLIFGANNAFSVLEDEKRFLENFMENYKAGNHNYYDGDKLRSLLNSNDLIVKNETVIFEAVKEFIAKNKNHDELKNFENELKLMFIDVIRLQYIPLKVLVRDVMDFFDSCGRCRKLVDNAICWHLNLECGNGNFKSTNRGVFSMYDKNIDIQDQHLELHNPIFNGRIRKYLNITNKYFGAGFVKKKLIVIGGRNVTSIESTVNSYDLKTGVMEKLKDLPEARENMAVVVDDSTLYVIGGNNANGTMNSVIRMSFDGTSPKWSSMKSMNQKRSRCSAVLYDHKIYVAGGSDDSQHHNTLEVFDVSKNIWTYKKPMKYVRINAGFVSNGELLYIIGGFNEKYEALETVERYETNKDTWLTMKNIKIRGKLSALSILDNIVAIDQDKYTRIQIYNVSKNEWNDPESFYKKYNYFMLPPK